MAYLSENQLKEMGFLGLGKNVRISEKASIYNPELISIGDHSRIDDFCVISGKVTIGRNVHIAVFCNIAGGTEGVKLEDFAGVAYGSQIFSQSDDYSGVAMTGPTVPEPFTHVTRKAVIVGRHVIIGTSSVVFPGVTLAEGTAVGAMSMVIRSTEPWYIYSGIPARKIKSRKRDLLELEQVYLATE